jgi:putative oxidoreductase
MSRCVAVFGLRVAASIAFVALGASKLAGAEAMTTMFEAIGFGPWLQYTVAAVEIVAGLGLLAPRLVAVSAYALCFVCLCAFLAHMFAGIGNPAGSIVLGIATAIITWTHREKLPALIVNPEGHMQ